MPLNRANINTIFAVIISLTLIYALLSWTCASLPFSYFYSNNQSIQDQEENSRLQNNLARHYLRSVQTDTCGWSRYLISNFLGPSLACLACFHPTLFVSL